MTDLDLVERLAVLIGLPRPAPSPSWGGGAPAVIADAPSVLADSGIQAVLGAFCGRGETDVDR